MQTQTFKDVDFMSAKEKELTLKDWKAFLQNGLKWEYFSRRLYEHLHIHCGFIAHYDRQGFHCEYFNSRVDAGIFFNRLFKDNSYYFHLSDYADLNNAMKEVYQLYKDSIVKDTHKEVVSKIALLEECVKRAKNDYEYAKKVLQELHL